MNIYRLVIGLIGIALLQNAGCLEYDYVKQIAKNGNGIIFMRQNSVANNQGADQAGYKIISLDNLDRRFLVVCVGRMILIGCLEPGSAIIEVRGKSYHELNLYELKNSEQYWDVILLGDVTSNVPSALVWDYNRGKEMLSYGNYSPAVENVPYEDNDDGYYMINFEGNDFYDSTSIDGIPAGESQDLLSYKLSIFNGFKDQVISRVFLVYFDAGQAIGTVDMGLLNIPPASVGYAGLRCLRGASDKSAQAYAVMYKMAPSEDGELLPLLVMSSLHKKISNCSLN